MMDDGKKRAILLEMYRIHEEYISSFNLACKIRCADCCTCNVTMTTIEGFNIACNLDDEQRKSLTERLKAAETVKRFRPAITVNGMAERCANDEDLPDEQLDATAGSCPLLVDKVCSIYEFRPFECRSFVSRHTCGEHGFADMADEAVNVNNLFRQYIEHIDADGMSGNLIDVLLKQLDVTATELIENRSVSVLMIDPEHKERLDGIMEELNTIQI